MSETRQEKDARVLTAKEGRAARTSGKKRHQSGEHTTLDERLIAGVPARIMRPRIVFIVCLIALVCFGVLMVYSASAVEAKQEMGSSTYYLVRQAFFAALGGFFTIVIALGRPFTLDRFRRGGAYLMLGVIYVLLALVFVFPASGGAHRWIDLGSFTLQPSEFAKPVIIILSAKLLAEYYEEHAIDGAHLIIGLAISVLFPLALIIAEPDTGTTLIIAVTVVLMAILSGLPLRIIVRIGVVAIALFAIVVIVEPYRLQRFQVASDPWDDPYGDGYQATLAIMAFASGGLFGRGIGNSTMKYNYLPEAHNDYIFAIIGEELGFVGTLIFVAVFLLLVYAALKVAEQSPTLYGKLIAAGCAVILGLQFFVNALGILGITPMTGKTMPFISYGGSSMITSLILAGLILRVSIESFEGNPYRARRSSFSVVGDAEDDTSTYLGKSTAGMPTPRTQTRRREGFSIVDGGAQENNYKRQRSSGRTRASTFRERGSSSASSTGGYERVNLNEDPAERLRRRRK